MLPPSCGYTIKAMQRDLVLVAPYDGCFVAVEVGPTLQKKKYLVCKVVRAYQYILLLCHFAGGLLCSSATHVGATSEDVVSNDETTLS